MGTFTRIPAEDIAASLEGTTRQYLVGNLARPQELDHVTDERAEVGLTVYTTPTGESPHSHRSATEYQYVVSGWTRYLDVVTGEEHDFRTGDFYAIAPGTTYAQKSRPGTTILFIKVPSIDDKRLARVTPDLQSWLDSGLTTRRTDHWHAADAPHPNSVRPAVAVAITDSQNRLLLLRRADSGNWTLPGGTIEHSDSLTSCAKREVAEETGLDVEITDVIGTYTDPDARIEYSDGEVRREFTVVLRGTVEGAQVTIDSESLDYCWVEADEIGSLPLATSQQRRIDDVRDYLLTGARALR